MTDDLKLRRNGWPADKIVILSNHPALQDDDGHPFNDALFNALFEMERYSSIISWFFNYATEAKYTPALFKETIGKLDYLYRKYQNILKEEKITTIKQSAEEFEHV